METYKVIEGFEDYSVSDHGNVNNNSTGLIKKVKANGAGYIQVGLTTNKKHYENMLTC